MFRQFRPPTSHSSRVELAVSCTLLEDIGKHRLESAWVLEARYSLPFWDALILAAARAAGCERVLSEDLSEGAVYDGVKVVNPFTSAPA